MIHRRPGAQVQTPPDQRNAMQRLTKFAIAIAAAQIIFSTTALGYFFGPSNFLSPWEPYVSSSEMFVMATSGIIFGLFLLMGAIKKKTGYLQVWILFAGISMLLFVISAILFGTDQIVGCILSLAAALFIPFGIKFVLRLIDEIEAKQEQAEEQEQCQYHQNNSS